MDAEDADPGVDMVGRILDDVGIDDSPDSLMGKGKLPSPIGRPVGTETGLRRRLRALHFSTLPEDVPVWQDFLLVYSTQPGGCITHSINCYITINLQSNELVLNHIPVLLV